MSKTRKITTNETARKSQRDQTNELIKASEHMAKLPLTAPTNLQGLAKQAWELIVPELNESGFVKSMDSATVELLCINIELYKKAYQSIQEDGLEKKIYKTSLNPTNGEIVAEDFVGWRANPNVSTINNCSAKINSLSTTLGLNPSSRAALIETVGTDTEEKTLADLLNGDELEDDEDFD